MVVFLWIKEYFRKVRRMFVRVREIRNYFMSLYYLVMEVMYL